jgi:xylan 1,4-beta-xylosidase
MGSQLRTVLTIASLATVALAEFGPGDNAFPDCANGPLKDNLVCDSTANYLDRANALVSALTLSEVQCNVVDSSCGVPRFGLAQYGWWSEALHGLADSPGVHFNVTGEFSSASQFPNGISLGAAFDDGLYSEIGAVILNETRAFNNHNLSGLTLYSPINVNPFK